MIVLTEIFIIVKHGNKDFSHASIPLLGYIFIGSLITLFLIILVKVLISDAINWNKKLNKSVN